MTTQNTDTQESAFLQNQRRVMAQKEQLERDQEQRQRYTLTPAANEEQKTFDAKAKYVVESFDVQNNTVERRVITPLPTPQRLQPASPIEKEELTEMIAELRQEMADQQERFDNKDAIDRERTAKKHELNARIIELIRQTNELKAELDSLTREGSVRDGFIAFAKQAESRITAIATGAYNYLLNKFSQDRHQAGYKELTLLLAEEIRFKVDRSGIRGLTQPTFATLHRVPADKVVNAQVEAVLEKVYTATEKLESALEK